MKKVVLLCAIIAGCSGLVGCGNQQQRKEDDKKISRLKSENSSLKATKSSSHKQNVQQPSLNKGKNETVSGSQTFARSGQQGSDTKLSSAGNVDGNMHDKDGRVVYPDGTRGPIPSPYREGTPEYDQWHAEKAESIQSAYNEPNLQLGPEPRANDGQ